MALNWTPEAILDIIIGVLSLFVTSITIIIPRTRKIKSIHLIDLAIISLALMMIFEAISIIQLNFYAKITSSIFIFFGLLFIVLAINYVTRESLISSNLLPIFSVGLLYIYFAVQLPGYGISVESGYKSIAGNGILQILGVLLQGLIVIYFLYWGVKTFLNSPRSIKREAKISLFGTMLISLGSFFFYLVSFIESLFILVSDFILLMGIIIVLYAIITEPQILYVLPYKIYQIIVKDKDGDPLFKYNWSNVELESNIFAGFLNAIKIMTEKVFHMGDPIEINLQKGVLIIQECNLITVGLVSSKSSKLIRDALILFTSAFEEKFQDLLLKLVKDPRGYQAAIELIECYFSNFPHFLMNTKANPLLLATSIPIELEKKLSNLISKDSELRLIKQEINQAPLDIIPEFLMLYDELNRELLENSAMELNRLEFYEDE